VGLKEPFHWQVFLSSAYASLVFFAWTLCRTACPLSVYLFFLRRAPLLLILFLLRRVMQLGHLTLSFQKPTRPLLLVLFSVLVSRDRLPLIALVLPERAFLLLGGVSRIMSLAVGFGPRGLGMRPLAPVLEPTHPPFLSFLTV